jgi:DNA-directed RNA polymerase I, II, and III subunit RPABC2
MEQLRFDSRIIHSEVQSVARQSVADSLKTERTTEPYYTKYEYTTLVGTRAQQIAEGSKPLISLDGMITSDPQFVWNVAEKEVAQKKLPFIIHRRLPSGVSEYWSAQELDILW